MILGVGIDTIEVSRVSKEIARSKGFKERYFSAGEIRYCEPKHGRAGNYAARFAAKEAFFKALGTGYRGGLAFKEVEVRNDPLGKPGIVLRGRTKELCRKYKIRRIHVSLTHIKDYSSAVVILEG
ncbi:MAG: holo-ACP synthase [Elusimicrobiota bacterium]|nr:holo-ACP synthase [Elusimicrobiota bacterium]